MHMYFRKMHMHFLNFDRCFRKCICNFGKYDQICKEKPDFEGSKAKKIRLRRFFEAFFFNIDQFQHALL